MKFVIITHAIHKIKNKDIFAYEPYVREMNLWLKYIDETLIVAPESNDEQSLIDAKYSSKKIRIKKIPSINILNLKSIVLSLILTPLILYKITRAILWADHIHLRCPGNIGLLGCFVQIFFPSKAKTVKYAGNWDPNSKQPLSYRIQKWIISNSILTKNCKVLVYGNWKNQTKNVIPFFTATYSRKEIIEIPKKNLNNNILFLYVGTFSKGKQPLKSVKTIEILVSKGYNAILNMYGDGEEFNNIKKYIEKNNLSNNIFLFGNSPKEVVKKAFQKSHFLLFISKSEGWPKVVAEAMFWRCLPISSKVSCVADMLGYGERGSVVNYTISESELSEIIIQYLKDKEIYQQKVLEAQMWSQKFTLEYFESEIKKILNA